ncbi:beta-galactosidase [Deinobacterium chartae]|uniref:Beta-galactosidase n=1 Tax=Deinobacterium chartae TaxID=521158 RepID=A0A841HWK7_9DEIO|nr:beta-galactosidase [Deinobacterium chartae]MBB6096590.1 beta-galactosidase [Deinobacterium chartae]
MSNTHLNLGVCYYPEHWPRDRWEGYAAKMKALGLRYVRIAEFAWSRMEPEEGVYTWEWLDEAIDVLHRAGLEVVLCTPTATPPAWLVRSYPEILAHDEHGRVREFGSRRHYDFASQTYRAHSRRITRELASRYGQHPAVVGWQTDNEFGCHGTTRSYGPASRAAFPHWLQQKYGSLEALNQAWGNVFWSQEYTAWDQILPPNLTVTEPNPSHVLDYARFASDMLAEFQEEQIAILRELSPGRWVTHNFMIFFGDFDHYRASEALDFVTWDNYPTGMLEFFSDWVDEQTKLRFARTGHPDLISFNHDLYRGLKQGRSSAAASANGNSPARQSGFWVMEQQCGQVNWAPYNPLPAAGAVQLWTTQAWAHGADTVSYFRWRAATMAQEVMHSGLLRHDETEDRGFHEVKALDRSGMPNGEVRAPVALLHDYESLWIFDQQRHNAGLSYWTQTLTYYCALRSLGIDVDIVHPDADLSAYRVIVAPALTLMPEARLQRLEAAAHGARLVFGPRTAYRTESGRAFENGQFGSFKHLFGGRLLQFDSLRPGLTVGVGEHRVTTWAESFEPREGQSLHSYGDGPLEGQCAVLRHGNVTTVGAHSATLVREVLREVLREAGLSPQDLPEGVRISRRAGVSAWLNFNSEPITVAGRELAPVSFTLEAEQVMA